MKNNQILHWIKIILLFAMIFTACSVVPSIISAADEQTGIQGLYNWDFWKIVQWLCTFSVMLSACGKSLKKSNCLQQAGIVFFCLIASIGIVLSVDSLHNYVFRKDPNDGYTSTVTFDK